MSTKTVLNENGEVDVDRLRYLAEMINLYDESLAGYVRERGLDLPLNMALNPELSNVIIVVDNAREEIRDHSLAITNAYLKLLEESSDESE